MGIVENMSSFVCPHCGERVDIFKSGGADKLAADAGCEILGRIPIEPDIVSSGDEGKPFVYFCGQKQSAKEFNAIAEKIINKTK